MDKAILIGKPCLIKGVVEVVRSFSYKLNVGNYESRDFFCSQKVTCDAEEAEEVSQQLQEFVQAQVLHSVGAYIRQREQQRQKGAA